MGNKNSRNIPFPPDSNEVLVQSFQLDAEYDFYSLPVCWPNKQAMFHVPKMISSHLSNFIPFQEAMKIIEDINQILLETAFPTKQCNFFLILCILFSFLSTGICMANISGRHVLIDPRWVILISITLIIFSVIFYFGLIEYQKSKRKSRLLTFIREWKETKNNGMFLSLGGIRTNRRVAFGNEQKGTYKDFCMATMDHKSLVMQGYLHIFVNYQERANWCQQNGVPFVPPVSPNPRSQVPVETRANYDPNILVPQQDQPPPTPQVPAETGANCIWVPQQNQPTPKFQAPSGYALVPDHKQPPPEFKVPDGYALVPQHNHATQEVPAGFVSVPKSEDSPPNYDQAKKM